MLSTAEAAERVGRSSSWLVVRLNKEELRGTRVGERGVWRIAEEDLAAFAEAEGLELVEVRTLEQQLSDLRDRVERLEEGGSHPPAGSREPSRPTAAEQALQDLVVRLSAANEKLVEHIEAATARSADEMRTRTGELLAVNRELTEGLVQVALPWDAAILGDGPGR